MVSEEERERISMSPAKRGLESRAEKMEGPTLPEAWTGLLGGVDTSREGGGAVYPDDDDVLED